jgi:hypothetical protein
MKKLMWIVWLAAVLIAVCFVGSLLAEEKMPAVEGPPASILCPEKPLVQMAILLDTSGSMSGLIDQARVELWAIVNEFIFARRNGAEPELQVALYEYGKSSLAAKDGFIRQIVPFTTDLDKVSEELFALKTNGGSEYCGWVIREATQDLKWSDSPDDLKVIFIAGNEPFTQGPVDYRKACKAAISKAIVVNTIHCGREGDGLSGNWKDGAVLADGRFLNIDHNRSIVHVEAPQDREIAELSARLNETYVAFGRAGQVASERQSAQDRNAESASKEAAIQRAVAKSSFNYKNESWDLVDALKNKKVELKDIEAKDLPEEMQKMTAEEKRAFIKARETERIGIQQRIQELNGKRKTYVADQMKKRREQGDTLGSAATKAVREQAKKRGFKFESNEKPSKSTEKAESPQ